MHKLTNLINGWNKATLIQLDLVAIEQLNILYRERFFFQGSCVL